MTSQVKKRQMCWRELDPGGHWAASDRAL